MSLAAVCQSKATERSNLGLNVLVISLQLFGKIEINNVLFPLYHQVILHDSSVLCVSDAFLCSVVWR